jgi:hypothetical protein
MHRIGYPVLADPGLGSLRGSFLSPEPRSISRFEKTSAQETGARHVLAHAG